MKTETLLNYFVGLVLEMDKREYKTNLLLDMLCESSVNKALEFK